MYWLFMRLRVSYSEIMDCRSAATCARNACAPAKLSLSW